MSEEEKEVKARRRNSPDGNLQDAENRLDDGNPSPADALFRMETDALLRPVSEDQPAGEDLRYENTYDLIREARREDDASLPQGVWERELKRADSEKVRDLCQEVIESRSKDLQVAVWLMEALFHLNGFYGVREGLRVILTLCRNFWDDLYPVIENGDIDARLSPLVWVNEKFSIQLKFEAIADPKSMDASVFSYADWEQANILENLSVSDKKVLEKAEQQNKPTRAKFLSSVMFTSSAFYTRHNRDLSQALENLTSLEEFLEKKCDDKGPSLAKFRKTLQDIHEMIGSFLKEKRGEIDGAENPDETISDGDSEEPTYTYGESGEMQSVALSIRSRAEAYRMLSSAADYLFIHEPHSPTPYLVRRAVSWGNMTLTELLAELVSDDQDLKLIFNLLGIKM